MPKLTEEQMQAALKAATLERGGRPMRTSWTRRNGEYISDEPYTWIYLMRCNRNGLIKIGRSYDPEVRERQLQANDPEIELILLFPELGSHERVLHARYADKRRHGEWFALSHEEIQEISLEGCGVCVKL